MSADKVQSNGAGCLGIMAFLFLVWCAVGLVVALLVDVQESVEEQPGRTVARRAVMLQQWRLADMTVTATRSAAGTAKAVWATNSTPLADTDVQIVDSVGAGPVEYVWTVRTGGWPLRFVQSGNGYVELPAPEAPEL